MQTLLCNEAHCLCHAVQAWPVAELGLTHAIRELSNSVSAGCCIFHARPKPGQWDDDLDSDDDTCMQCSSGNS